MPGKDREDRVRNRAYCLAQQAGFPPGRDQEFWLRAEEVEPKWLWPGRMRTWLAAQKDALSTLQTVATLIAIGVGALWTWWLFDPVAQRSPNLYVTQTVEAKHLGHGLLLLHVNFVLENTGKVTAYLTCAAVIVSQVIPPHEEDLSPFTKGLSDWDVVPSPDWYVLKWKVDPQLGEHEFFVEVGNKAQYTADFVVPELVMPGNEKLRTIQLYSNFQRKMSDSRECRRKPNGGIEGPGWSTTTLFEISG